jgi:hypothetical protein
LCAIQFSTLELTCLQTNNAPPYAVNASALGGYNMCFQTDVDGVDNPFVTVDLGASKSFDFIALWAATDCSDLGAVCVTRNVGFQVRWTLVACPSLMLVCRSAGVRIQQPVLLPAVSCPNHVPQQSA